VKRLAMCESILLTAEEIAREQDNAVVAFHQPGGPDGDLELGDYVNRYVCRAQVRKVMRWVEKHKQWEDEYSYWLIEYSEIALALKAAGKA